MEEKKLDVNSIIGFALIGVIMFVYVTWFTPKPVEKTTDNQINKTKQTTEAVKNIPTTPIKTGSFTSEETKIKEVSLTNDWGHLIFSSKGAMLKKAKLLKYYSYNKQDEDHKSPLFLLAKDNADFNIKFKENGQEVNTRDLFFKIAQKGEQLTFSTQTKSGGELSIIYTLKDHYLLDFDIKTKGLSIVEKPILQFNLKAFAHEKGRKEESRRTKFYYALNEAETVKSAFSKKISEKVNWVACKGQYFSLILDSKLAFDSVKLASTEIKDSLHLKQMNMQATFAKSGLDADMQWYLGPNDTDIMKKYKRNYQEVIPLGWFLFGILNKYFFVPMYKLLSSIGWFSAGIVIMIMTLIVKLITSPVMYKQYKQGAMMRVLRPEMDEINEKYKNADAMKKQQATMELYRKTGVNPMAGCLPALLQMPIFIALFDLFPNLINLRGKSFLWADDLSSYDSIFQLPFNIPFYGSHVSLFTLLYAATMLIYTRLSSSGMQQPTQPGMPNMKYITYVMPLMLLVWINSYASGLSWYYFVSNTISILLVLIIKRYFIDEGKIHSQLQENKKKPKKKKGRFARMLEEAQRQQKAQQAMRKGK